MARQLQNLPGKVWQILLGITPVPLCTCDLGQRWGEGWHGMGRPRGSPQLVLMCEPGLPWTPLTSPWVFILPDGQQLIETTFHWSSGVQCCECDAFALGMQTCRCLVAHFPGPDDRKEMLRFSLRSSSFRQPWMTS